MLNPLSRAHARADHSETERWYVAIDAIIDLQESRRPIRLRGPIP
jgi:hypothetical protein